MYKEIGNMLTSDEEGNVLLTDPIAFHSLTTEGVKIANAEDEMANSSELLKYKRVGEAAQIPRWSQLWSPFGRKAINVAIVSSGRFYDDVF